MPFPIYLAPAIADREYTIEDVSSIQIAFEDTEQQRLLAGSQVRLKLRYHLIEYGPGSPVTERRADRLAEGEFSVTF